MSSDSLEASHNQLEYFREFHSKIPDDLKNFIGKRGFNVLRETPDKYNLKKLSIVLRSVQEDLRGPGAGEIEVCYLSLVEHYGSQSCFMRWNYQIDVIIGMIEEMLNAIRGYVDPRKK
ncbi:MAG: hypothetical protein PHU71_00655 [Candidatus Gracilibacteria bacterium]|nr:hypothetical protein [Candidatus Gracilibacteria bacterium]